MSLPVSDEQIRHIAANAGGTAYLVIPGVEGVCICNGDSPPDPACPGLGPHPDPLWVALAACDTCGGLGKTWNDGSRCVPESLTDPESTPYLIDCPAVYWEGQPVHQLTAECDRGSWKHCLGVDGQGICDECWGANRVVLAEVTVTNLVPFIAVPETGYPHGAPDRFVYLSKAGSFRIVDRIAQTDTYIGLRLIGVPSPGDWVAILQVRKP